MQNFSELQPAICPQCNGGINVQSNITEMYCQYCGTKFFVKNAIEKHKVQNITVNQVNNYQFAKKGIIEAIADFSERQNKQQIEFLKRFWWLYLIPILGAIAFMIIMILKD